MNIRNLEYFIKVVDTNSFTKAAEELFISQSAISQQIKALEDELGFPLMIRNRKGFELTQAGKYLYIEGKNIIANIKEIENHATYISKNNNKELKIGHVVNYGYQELKKALRIFSAKYPEIKIIAVEPSDSPLISKGKAGSHGIQGIGANFIPEILDLNIIDEVITVDLDEAYQMSRLLAKKEGLLVGISSGAALAASKLPGENKNVVVLLPDTGERYLSTALFE